MVTTPRGEARSVIQLEPTNLAVTYSLYSAPGGNAASWFGPNRPVAPTAPPDVAGRQWDFPAGFNLPFSPRQYEPVDFSTLRALADTYDLLRLVIETRKDQMCAWPWTISPKNEKYKRPGAKVPAALQSRALDLKTFFRRPDGVTAWRLWLRELLEDHYVIDAASLYCDRTRAGQLTGLSPMDGATIKRIIDPWGRTPRPYTGPALTDEQIKQGFKVFNGLIYPPAYQQILKNLPAVNYTTRDLIYAAENMRTNKAYGFSRVEQIIMTVNIALRRQVFQLAYYTEGNIPESLIGVPDQWSPDQIKQFQDYWDSYFLGNLAARRHAKFVPGGVAKTFIQTKEPELKNAFDEWLARVVCFAFSTSPQPFMAMMNRATAETNKEQSTQEGPEATKEFVKSHMDTVIELEFGEDELEFKFLEQGDVNPTQQETILTGYTKAAVITLNEAREDLGRDPYPTPEANDPMVLTATGYVPLSAYQEGQDRADTIARAGAGGDGPGGVPEDGDPPSGKGGGLPSGGGKPKGGPDDTAKGVSIFDRLGITTRLPAPARSERLTKAKKAGRRLAPIPFVRRATREAQKGIRAAYVKAFDAVRADVIAQLREMDDFAKFAIKLGKARRRNADTIADDLDLSGLDAVSEDVIAEIEGVRADTGVRALVQLGVQDKSELVDQVNERAEKRARAQAAELVSNVEDSTRDMLRDIIADGLDENVGLDEITANIESATAFSEDRASLIARTEITNANSEAAVDGYRAASEGGVSVRKVWILGENPCPICEENADAGPIDLDDEFPSGDDAPSAHPNCECAVSPVVDE